VYRSAWLFGSGAYVKLKEKTFAMSWKRRGEPFPRHISIRNYLGVWIIEKILRKHFIFYGRVQGVGFRYRAYSAAIKLGLSGFVSNLYNGTVEMEVQGTEEEINRLVVTLDQTKPIRIEGIDSEEIPVKHKEKGFRMLN